MRRSLAHGGFIELVPNWLSERDADEYLRSLLCEIPWEQGEISMFGRKVLEPRLTAWFGDADYTYSGRTLRKTEWPAFLQELRARAASQASEAFNSVLLNLYRNGQDSMGLHSDAEPELGENPVIASVSLGATRRFVLRPKSKQTKEAGIDLELEHGSLLVMGGTCQHFFKHGVPKQPEISAARVNLTFRHIR